MKEFIKTRFLFVSTYDVAYGDFMTNSLITNYICDYFDNEILFHYLISDTTSERISWFIENQNSVTKITNSKKSCLLFCNIPNLSLFLTNSCRK